MNKQRLAILICAALGMLAIFMPWVNVPILGAINGTRGNTGWITFVIFIAPLIISLVGDRMKGLDDTMFYIVMAAGIVNAGVAIYKIVDFNNNMGEIDKANIFSETFSSTVSVGFGLYLVAITGIALPVLGFIFKDKNVTVASNPDNVN